MSLGGADLSRRAFLRLAAGGFGLAVLLEACTPAPVAKPTASGPPATGPLPTYIPATGGPKPDLHSTDPRITDGFLRYPKDPPKSWTGGPPGNGGTLNVFMAAYYPAPTPRDQNATWKEVEKALNSTVNMTIIPNADYSTRLQVVIAGSDLPDLIHIGGGPVGNLISSQFVPKDAEDFKKILEQLNRPQESRWAIGNFGPTNERVYGLVGFLEMFGAPNVWTLGATGKLIRDRETEPYKAAIGYMKDLLSSGLYPPDVQTAGDSRGNFLAGRFVVSTEAFGNGWNDMWRRGLQLNPQRHFTIVRPFSAVAGEKPRHFISGGTVAYNLLKKGSPDRVREILRILNYLSAPFGTQEDLLLTYGLRDQDYTVDTDSNPLPTQAGTSSATYVPWQYMAHRPYTWYQADLPGFAEAAFEIEQILVGVGVADPTRGFHSATQSRKGVAAEQAFHDGIADILFNRRPFGDFDQLVNEWRTSVGDVVRKEFQDEISAASKTSY